MRKIFITLIIAVLFCGISLSGELMSVYDIVDLYEEGVSISVIKASIDAKDATFDISTEEIKLLHNAGVPDELITYIISREPGQGNSDNNDTFTLTGGEKAKVGSITVNLYVDYGISTKEDEQGFYFALKIGDKIEFAKGAWDEKYVLDEGKGKLYRYASSFVESLAVTKSVGKYPVSVYLWTGVGKFDNSKMSSYKIFTKTVNIKSGSSEIIDLNISEGSDNKPLVEEG